MRYLVRRIPDKFAIYQRDGQAVRLECTLTDAIKQARDFNRMTGESFDADRERARLDRKQEVTR